MDQAAPFLHLRLTLEGMRQSLVQHINAALAGHQEDVRRIVAKAVADFDIEAEVRTAADLMLREEVLVMVNRAVRNALYDLEAGATAKAAVEDALHRLAGRKQGKPRK